MNINKLNKYPEFISFAPEWAEVEHYAPDMGNAFLSEGWDRV